MANWTEEEVEYRVIRKGPGGPVISTPAIDSPEWPEGVTVEEWLEDMRQEYPDARFQKRTKTVTYTDWGDL